MKNFFFNRGDGMSEDKHNEEIPEEVIEQTEEEQSSDTIEENTDKPEEVTKIKVEIKSEPEEPPESESERYIRLAAEFDNYKKRTAREFGDLVKSANTRLLRSLVEIADNFERAIEADENDKDSESYKKGVELIYGQLSELLKKEHVTAVASVGKDFDPNLHEAMMQQESEEYDEGVVMMEVQKGYQIDDKVLRHARVIVSSGKKQEEDKKE